MEKLFIENGGKLIQDMIDSAVAAGENQVTITGNYLIEKTILIPSCLLSKTVISSLQTVHSAT